MSLKDPEARRKYKHDWYVANRTRLLKTGKARWQRNREARCISKRAYYQAHKEQYAESARRYRQEHADAVLERNRRWRMLHPKAALAHQRARTALRRGEIEARQCAKCGAGESLDLHHHDYDQATAVVVLCRSCHILLHRRGGLLCGTSLSIPA